MGKKTYALQISLFYLLANSKQKHFSRAFAFEYHSIILFENLTIFPEEYFKKQLCLSKACIDINKSGYLERVRDAEQAGNP